MNPDETPGNSPSSPPGRFGLSDLILSVIVMAVLMFVGVTMFRRFNRVPEGIGVLYPVFAPMALMVTLGIVYSIMRVAATWQRRRARRRAKAEAIDEAG